MKYESKRIEYSERDAALLKACGIPTTPDELPDKVSKFKHRLIWLSENWKIGKIVREKTQKGFSFYVSYFFFKVYLTELLRTDLNHPFVGYFQDRFGQWCSAENFALTTSGYRPAMGPKEEESNMIEEIKKHVQLEPVNVPGQLNGKCPFCLDENCVLQVNTESRSYRTTLCHTMTGWDEEENRIRVPDPQSRSLADLIQRFTDPIAYIIRNL